MDADEEFVVLVDEADREIGIEKKSRVHTLVTHLHRAFSLFLFKSTKELLLQQRSETKKTWPGIWSNSCCGHPLPDESYEDAVLRRARFELGIELHKVKKAFDYQYCFSKDGIMENEICPVYTGIYDGTVQPRPDEVQAIQWINWEDWVEKTIQHPDRYTPWCVEETRILASDKNFLEFILSPSGS
ncbi:MAG: isopentenyl-diphosphate delta-isomerase [Desulfobacula sp. RIFOXYB2_FULL_45_6]|nr:MAG: isopentenyl-diphosphate delta-isomerase [Desulfobacula sp. RIFOXYB2_FULL_45_6]